MSKRKWAGKTSKGYLIAIVVIAGIVIIILAVWNPLNKYFAEAKIPPIPSMEGHPEFLARYINQAHKKALNAPFSGQVVGNLAKVFHSNSFYDQAASAYNLAHELDADEWHWPYYKAQIAEQIGDIKNTIENLLIVVELNPNVSMAWFKLGKAYMNQNDYPQALTAFAKIPEIKNPFKPKLKGVEFSNKGAFPIKTYAIYNLARIEFLQNNYIKAKKHLLNIIEDYPRFGSAYRLLSQVYNSEGDKANALIYKELAGDFANYIPPADPALDELVFSSRQSEFILKQFDIARNSENVKWAMVLLVHILKFNPEDKEALIKFIKLGFYLKRTANIESLVKKFLLVFENDEIQLQKMAEFIIKSNQHKYAVELLKQAIRLNPQAFDSHVSYMKILNHFSRFNESLSHGRKVLSRHPNNVQVRNEIARTLSYTHKLNQAKEELNISLQNDPQNADTFFELGMIAREQGDAKNAIHFFKRSIEINSLNIVSQMALVNYLLERGQYKEALSHLNASLKVSPNNIDLLERKAWIKAACPQASLRNGKQAMTLAQRLNIRSKNTTRQTLRCGIVLAVSHGELGQYKEGLVIAEQYYQMAQNLQLDHYSDKLKTIIEKFKNGVPYRGRK